MIVGSDAATEYTRDARVLLKHLPKYIPGNRVIILRNMLGAANNLYQPAARGLGARRRRLLQGVGCPSPASEAGRRSQTVARTIARAPSSVLSDRIDFCAQ